VAHPTYKVENVQTPAAALLRKQMVPKSSQHVANYPYDSGWELMEKDFHLSESTRIVETGQLRSYPFEKL
jgi:hypothetical protein